MKIAVIGTGNIGASLIRYFRKTGKKVLITNSSGLDSMELLARETGAIPTNIEDVAVDADIVVLAIPQTALKSLPQELLARAKKNVIVIDCTNYFPQWFGKIEALENGMTESTWVQLQINHPVIKVFNTILAGSLANSPRPIGHQERIALSIFGDDLNAKEIVATLVDDIGFDPVICGSIEESWRAQPGSPIYCTDLKKEQLQTWYSRVERNDLSNKRDANMASVMSLPQTASWKDHVKAIRSVVLPLLK